ncbi:Low affinity ammonium transporter [Pseudocercospora fuligena]|uniref:Low affinity ammonium transporter n=1 Tax=Pseudocercospora fuligena TaxID=685502 RepID=A0A8H6RAW1_9PEZI|nr:Low affinity ammonium transporter [Pseudocercospora fuligena]
MDPIDTDNHPDEEMPLSMDRDVHHDSDLDTMERTPSPYYDENRRSRSDRRVAFIDVPEQSETAAWDEQTIERTPYADLEGQRHSRWSHEFDVTEVPLASTHPDLEGQRHSRWSHEFDMTDVPLDGPASTHHDEKQYDAIEIEGYHHDEKDSEPPKDTNLNFPLWKEVLFIGVTVMANFLSLAALAQSLAAQSIIARSLNVTNVADESWFSASYSLTAGTFVLISGRLGDIFSHKRLLIGGYLILGLWSILAGLSHYTHSQIFFDVCRAMQGIGSAAMIPNALALIGRAYEKGMKKNLIFALFGAMAPWGAVSGFFFASLFGQLVWWPWLFWSYGIAALFLACAAVIAVPGRPEVNMLADDKSRSQRPGMDWTGSVLGVTSLVLINVAWNNAPAYGWGTPHVYVLLILGVLALGAFFWVESQASSPILPLSQLTWTVSYTLLLLACGWGSFGIWLYYIFRFLSELRHLTPLAMSAQITPVLVCGLLAAGTSGLLLTHAPVAFIMMLSMFAFATSSILVGTLPVEQTYWAQTFVVMIIAPFAMDMSFPAASVILSNAMSQEHQGLAASLIVTVVQYSISIALGIAGTVETSIVSKSQAMTPEGVLAGIRAACYTSIGLASVGAILGVLFFVLTMIRFMRI